MDFGLQVGTVFGRFVVDFRVLLGSWNQLGPRWRPEPSKRASGSDFGGFWAPTWWFLGPNLLDFGWILDPSCLIFDASFFTQMSALLLLLAHSQVMHRGP